MGLPRSWMRWILMAVVFNAAVYFFLSPTYLNPDGIGYLAYLPSLFYEHTLSFASTYTRYHIAIPPAITPTGWWANNWAFGTAFLWLPFYWASQLYYSCLGLDSGPISGMAIGFINFGTMVFGILCLAFLADSLSALWRMKTASPNCEPVHNSMPGDDSVATLLILSCIFFGTPLFFYTFLSNTSSHAATAFASGLFLWFWWRGLSQPLSDPKAGWRWFALGLLGGIATMVRTQEGLVLLAPLVELYRHSIHPSEERSHAGKALGFLTGGTMLGFLPQALLWQFLYGAFWHAPAAFNISLAHFALLPFLFSSFHGLLSWTPLYGLGILGLVWASIRKNWIAQTLLAIVVGQLIINSLSVAWWEGLSFGQRQMTGTVFPIGIGLAYLLQARLHRFWKKGIIGAMVLCSLWSLVLAMQSYARNLDLLLSVSPKELVGQILHIRLLVHGLAIRVQEFHQSLEEAWWMFILLEILMISWWVRLRKIVVPKRPAKAPFRVPQCAKDTSSKWVVFTFLPILFYTNYAIFTARNGNRPTWERFAPLNDKELAHFFIGEAYGVEALMYQKQGKNDLSNHYFSLAETTLPHTPATQPWWDQFQQWKASPPR